MKSRWTPGIRPPRVWAGMAILASSMAWCAEPLDFDIASGELKFALDSYVQQTGQQLIYKVDDVKGRQTKGVKGRLSPDDALERLLDGTTLQRHTDGSGAILVFIGEAAEGGSDSRYETAAEVERVVITSQRVSHMASRNRTGTRTDTDPMELSQSVATVKRELIEEQQARDLDEALRSVAGVRRAFNASGYQMRGMEAAVTTNGSLGDNTSTRTNVPTFAIETIEVVRGPESVIGGQQGGYGGVINVITKTADGRKVREAYARVGSQREMSAGLDLGGSFDEQPSLNYRVLLDRERRGPTPVGFDGSRRDYVAPSFGWEDRTGGTSLLLEAVYDRAFTQEESEVFTIGRFTDELVPRRLAPANSGFHSDSHNGAIALSQRLWPGWTLRWKIDYSTIRTTSLYGLTEVTIPQWPTVSTTTIGYSTISRFLGQRAELYGTLNTSALGHRLLLACDRAKLIADPSPQHFFRSFTTNLETGAQADTSAANGLPVSVPFPGAQRSEQGILVQDQWMWGAHWAGVVALRAVHGRATDDDDRWVDYRRNLPTLGITYRVDPSLSLYGNRSAGYRSNAEKRDSSGHKLADEQGRQIEVGFKWLLADDTVAVTGSLFKIAQRHVALPDLTQLPNSFFVLMPGIHSQGGELEASGAAGARWNWRASIAYTDARNDTDDSPVRFQSRMQAAIYARYNFEGAAKASSWISGDLAWAQGASWVATSLGNLHQPARDDITFNLGAGYTAREWSLAAGVRNLFNRRIYRTGSPFIEQPRAVSVTGTVAF